MYLRTENFTFDALLWFRYLAFDITDDLAFGKPFGMLSRGQDLVASVSRMIADLACVAAIEALNRRGVISATLGCFP